MLSGFRIVLRLLAVWTVIPALVVCQTAQPLDRHARKIEKTLAGWPAGAVVLVTKNDGRQYIGQLGPLGTASFELIQRSGSRLTIDYAAAVRLQKADSVSGNRVVFRHHHGLVVALVMTGALTGLLILAAVELGKS